MSATEHHFNLYKNAASRNNSKLTERRKQLLSDQKRQRTNTFDDRRGIQNVIQNLRQNKSKRKQPKKNYRNQLQLAEWLNEKPEDFQNWYLIPCPKGVRCIVVAVAGITEVFSKHGVFLRKFHSSLPGDRGNRQFTSILDCIYVEETQQYWVLDALAYANQDLINCEASFRLFWIASKIEEEQLSEISELNEFSFKSISFTDCANEGALQECLMNYPMWTANTPELDGLLFYHKESSYAHGTTPLVGWLFPFMVTEVLGITCVRPEFLADRPDDYTGSAKYIEQFDAAQLRKKKKRRERHRATGIIERMDDEESVDNIDLDAERILEIDGECTDDTYYEGRMD